MGCASCKERVRIYIKELKAKRKNWHWLKSWRCLRRLLRKWNNEAYIEDILNLGNDPNSIEIKSFGNENLEKNLFLIEVHGVMGLGGYMRHTLHALFEAEKLGFVPIVYYADSCPCKEFFANDEFDNPFEYYFQQTSSLSLSDVYRSGRVFLFKPPHLYRIERELGNLNPDLPGGYCVDDAYLQKMSGIVKKYLHLNDSVGKKLDKDREELFKKVVWMDQVLGIHIRGTDFLLHWKNHPNCVLPEDYFLAIDDALARGFSYLFLATDDRRYVECFEKRYGSKVLYYQDTYRSDGVCNIAFEESRQAGDSYRKGLEVLRDMYTLAHVGGLIAGLSQVSIIARILCLSVGREYRYIKILDNGLYRGH